ncbi:winged helix-turn-helix domain-containing protein [Streptomyces sp. NPDC048106]|uniref:winged helix-turn-helix domain-containing protein n=1 Tax=Streptomyces sp. NPDC048106 TaxID=3155750 RepID=UPI003456E0CC
MAYTIQGVRKLRARNGRPWQVPARRAMERDDEAVAGWVEEVWPCAEDSRRPVEPGSSSSTKPDSPCRRRTRRPGHGAAGPRWCGSAAAPADGSPSPR